MNEATLPKSECPICFYEMDAATALEGDRATPMPGDYSLCINCGALLVFEERSQLRQATEDDMEFLFPDQRDKIQITQQFIRASNRASKEK